MDIDFAARFRSLTARETGDHDPFPWQERLFRDMILGQVPGALDLPTGLGKTRVMAIWLLAHAAGADLPRRLIYVVDRRAVVDQASDEAEILRDNAARLDWPTALRPKISTLRGAHIDKREWLEDPAALAIVVGTVDMIGSRLMFQGYGVGRGMRPYHAAMLGTDTLVVLDEAHLVPPFQALIDAVAADRTLHGRERPPIGGVRLMTLSATLRPGAGARFGLCDDDRAHPVIDSRLNAPKILDWRAGKNLPDAMVAAAKDLAQHHPAARIVIYCDKREDAEKVAPELSKAKIGKARLGEVALFVGARRMHERSLAADELKRLGFLAGTKPPRTSPAFLVATSAAEVGVDLDADHMVCDLVPWERMVQRLGRVNRRGEGAARVILCETLGATVAPDPGDDPDRDPTEDIADDAAPAAEGKAKAKAEPSAQLKPTRDLLQMLPDAALRSWSPWPRRMSTSSPGPPRPPRCARP